MVGFCERFPSHPTTLSASPTQLLVGQLTRLPFRSGYATGGGGWDQQEQDHERLRQRAETSKGSYQPRKGRVLLVGDSLVRHVGRNLEQQCAGLSTVCKPGGRIEQMVS